MMTSTHIDSFDSEKLCLEAELSIIKGLKKNGYNSMYLDCVKTK
jgi:hypothetical protein